MKGLLLKDFSVHKLLYAFVIFYAILWGLDIENEISFYTTNSAVWFCISIMYSGGSNAWTSYSVTLPISRKTYILSKHISTVFTEILLYGFAFLSSWIGYEYIMSGQFNGLWVIVNIAFCMLMFGIVLLTFLIFDVKKSIFIALGISVAIYIAIKVVLGEYVTNFGVLVLLFGAVLFRMMIVPISIKIYEKRDL